MVAARNPVMYEEALRRRAKSEWKLARTIKLDSIKRNNSLIHFVFTLDMEEFQSRVVLKRKLDKQGHVAH